MTSNLFGVSNEKKVSSKLTDNISANLDPKLAYVFVPWLFKNPRYLRASIRLLRSVKRAKKVRVQAKENGLVVPPFLIISITSKCNLQCSGCYFNASPKTGSIHRSKPQLEKEQWCSIIAQAAELGVMGFVFVGGEPFLYPGILDICHEFKDKLFIIITNGTTLTPIDYKKLKRSTNIVVLASIEGDQKVTDQRRGRGVHEKVLNTLQKLTKLGVPNGISVTITRQNYKYWLEAKNIDQLIEQGIKFGVFLEYIPNTPSIISCVPDIKVGGASDNDSFKSDHELMLTTQEREEFRQRIHHYRETRSIYLIHSPGDEEFFGGCVSAGRGFAHINPNGDLTPCPVSNIATHNLTDASLRDGLASPLFKAIRDNEHLLETKGMPCALFAHPKEVDELAKKVGAYRTDDGERSRDD